MFKALFLALTLAAGWTTVSNQETAATETSSSLPLLSIGAPEALQDPELPQASSPEPLRFRKIERLPKTRSRTAPKLLKPPVAQAPTKMHVVRTSAETKRTSSAEHEALLGEIQRLQEENSRLQSNLQGKAQRHQVQDQDKNRRDPAGAVARTDRRKPAREVESTERRENWIVKEEARDLKAQKRALAARERVLIGERRILIELNSAEHAKHAEKANKAALKVHKRHTELQAEGAARAAKNQIEFEIAVQAERKAEHQQSEAHKEALVEFLHSANDLQHERLPKDSIRVEHVIRGIAEGHDQTMDKTYRVQLRALLSDSELGHVDSQEELRALQGHLEGLMEHLESSNENNLEELEYKLEHELEVLEELYEHELEVLEESYEHELEVLEELYEQQEEAFEELEIHLDEASGEDTFRVQLINGLDQLVDHKDLAKLFELKDMKDLAVLEQLAELGNFAELRDLQGFIELSESGNAVALRGLNHFFEKVVECDDNCCDNDEACCEEEDDDCCDDNDSECEVPIVPSVPMIGKIFKGNGQSNAIRVETTENGEHVIIRSGEADAAAPIIKGRILNQTGITVDGRVTVYPEISKDEPRDTELWLRGSAESKAGVLGGDTFHFVDSNGKTFNVSGDKSFPTAKKLWLKTETKFPQTIHWRTSDSTAGRTDILPAKAPSNSDCAHCKGTCGTSVVKIQNQGGQVYIDTHEFKTTEASTDQITHLFPGASAPSAPTRTFYPGQTPPSPVYLPATCDPKADTERTDTTTRADDGVSMRVYPNTTPPVISTFQAPVYEAYPEAVRDYTFASQSRSEDTTLIELERMLNDVLLEVDALQAEVDRVRVRVTNTQSR